MKTGFVVATAIPQVIPGSCGWISVADQNDVLATIVGAPTPEVEENLDDSAVFERLAYLFESAKKVSSAVLSDLRSEIACERCARHPPSRRMNRAPPITNAAEILSRFVFRNSSPTRFGPSPKGQV